MMKKLNSIAIAIVIVVSGLGQSVHAFFKGPVGAFGVKASSKDNPGSNGDIPGPKKVKKF
jgi:hypothetical protein